MVCISDNPASAKRVVEVRAVAGNVGLNAQHCASTAVIHAKTCLKCLADSEDEDDIKAYDFFDEPSTEEDFEAVMTEVQDLPESPHSEINNEPKESEINAGRDVYGGEPGPSTCPPPKVGTSFHRTVKRPRLD
ncbi:unnamed protein product [Bemisia tabaci]|uniref:Uncharacterized protein n=1 Tax=Bemisia tabaci TaxID=7038 RepID=A0A9P0F2C4_BEMTA|nr:unnamed protein product [Bemisia tabaci]